ncbi:MAG TPA: formate dehydrogenase accessory protein FdhE [Thermodesulfovibrionales bacterium]|jgi:FdhE protein|nr:formate dehydrogenase accessory protein FdhE [Thermodesulfovibrionales bacterium]
MDIEGIAIEKPHLKDILRLYEKATAFVSRVSALARGIPFDDVAYPSLLIDPIFETFLSVFDLAEETLFPLKEALKSGQIDFTRLPRNELAVSSLPYHEDELGVVLYLLGKPYFSRLRELHNLDNVFWEKGRCPLCRAKASFAAIDHEGKRDLCCSYCLTIGTYRRIGCPLCSTDDSSLIKIFTAEEENGFRIDACDRCGSYVKTVNQAILDNDSLTPELADLVSLPLDIIAQGKGYHRLARNPVGMLRMV